MHVLMLTIKVDRRDWLQGFIHSWIARMAEHVDRLTVIGLEVGEYDFPPNVSVHTMGKELGYGRLRRFFAVWRAIRPVIRDVDVIFGHMIPRYTLIAAPWALIFGVPMVQWYTHRQVHLELQLAYALVRRVVTASPESFTLPGDKVMVLGHGIDTTRFRRSSAAQASGDEPGRLIVAVGRLSPIKHYETLIEGMAHLLRRPGFEDVRLVIAGGVTEEHGEAYKQSLLELAQQHGVADRITFLGAVPHQDIPALYHRAAVTVNLCPTGGADKAVLESMASSVPVVVHNRTFLPLLEADADLLWCEALAPAQVAEHLARVLTRPQAERDALGERLYQRMQADYALDGFIERLVAVLEEVATQYRRGRR